MRYLSCFILSIAFTAVYVGNSAKACVCIGPCSFLGAVDTMFANYKGSGTYPVDVTVFKGVIVDTIPGWNYAGVRIKVLDQYFGRPMRDTIYNLGPGSDCEVNLRYNMHDTVFLMMHRYDNYSARWDSAYYSLSVCARRIVVVHNDTVRGDCRNGTISAVALGDSLHQHIQTLGVMDATEQQVAVCIIPNPATTTLTIESARLLQSVAVYNAVGVQTMLVEKCSEPKYTIDCSSWPAGIYIVATKVEGIISRQRVVITK